MDNEKEIFSWDGLVTIGGLCDSGGVGEREKIYGKTAPVISQSFAAKQIRPGDKWKVYLNASDPDGEMKTIISMIDQKGEGTYTAGFTRIREDQQRGDLSGYIYLNTAGLQGLTYITLLLNVQIQDKAGHYSAPVSFSLAFKSGSHQENPPPGVFQEKELGPIMITEGGTKGSGE